LHARQTPNKLAVVFEGKATTYGQLMKDVESASAFFSKQLGNSQQKVVALVITNSTDFIVI